MIVPTWGRVIAAVAGGGLVLMVWASVIGALIVSRAVGSRLTRLADRCVNGIFQMAVRRVDDFRRRDRLLSVQGAAILLGQLVAWLSAVYLGFALLLWPFEAHGAALGLHRGRLLAVHAWFRRAAGHSSVGGGVPGRRDRAGRSHPADRLPAHSVRGVQPPGDRRGAAERPGRGASWGPELLARTHYALGSGVSTIDTLPDLYAQWERWAADVAESHTTYLPLVRFRSPRPLSSWVTALLAVMDSAALFLALSPKAAPVVPARLCLRSGLECFGRIARAMGFDIPEEPDPDGEITLTYEEFLDAVERLKEVNFPLERDPADAWPDFVGWRLNYEEAAYAVAYAVDAVHGLWSGPRIFDGDPVAPIRPGRGRVSSGRNPDPLSPSDSDSQIPARRADFDPAPHTEPHERAQLPGVDPRRLPAREALRPGLGRDPDGGVEPDLPGLLVG